MRTQAQVVVSTMLAVLLAVLVVAAMMGSSPLPLAAAQGNMTDAACNAEAYQDCASPIGDVQCAAVREFKRCAEAAGCLGEVATQAVLASYSQCLQEADMEVTDGTIVFHALDVEFALNDGLSMSVSQLGDTLESTATAIADIEMDTSSLSSAIMSNAAALGGAEISLESSLTNISMALSTAISKQASLISANADADDLSNAIDTLSAAVNDSISTTASELSNAITSTTDKLNNTLSETIFETGAALRNTIDEKASLESECLADGLVYDGDQEECVASSPIISSTPFECNMDSTGRLRYDGEEETLQVCNGEDFVYLSANNCDGDMIGRSHECPAHSCAQIKQVNPAAASGMYLIGTLPPAKQVYCDMQYNISRGGNGTHDNPGTDCLTLKDVFNLPSGAYWLDTPTGLVEAYCEMELDNGGWQVVWLHRYYEAGTITSHMRFFEQFNRPCTSLLMPWCNSVHKTAQRAVDQMTVAYRNGVPQYAYRAHANQLLDTDYRGAILADPVTRVLDNCRSGSGIRPEPVSPDDGTAYPGLTFDKANPEKHTGNCDTDRYGGGSDCRWENCQPDGTNHNQMTMAIMLRTSEEVAIQRAIEEQHTPLSSCQDVLDMPAPQSGLYPIAVGTDVGHHWCQLNEDGDAVVDLGGNGLSEASATVHCSVLLEFFQRPSGTYWIDNEKGVGRGYCEMDIDGGGWHLIWKHTYHELYPVNDNMRFFSSFNRPCLDIGKGWCNENDKKSLYATEQMTVAYHFEQVVYAYAGDKNAHHDIDWTAAILNNPRQIADTCQSSNGVAPEPEGPVSDHSWPGLTLDKTNPGVFSGNCDTDVYGSSTSDCRWENCNPSTGYHNQMTVGMFFRAPADDIITRLFATQQAYSSCKEIKEETGSRATGQHTVLRDGSRRLVYCDMERDNGGWELVWKHSYNQVGTVSNDMRFFSQHNRPCTDLSDGWCNEPGKTQRGASEIMITAQHHGILYYAYKGPMTSTLDTDWTGAILEPATNLYDQCRSCIGCRIEPVHPDQGFAIAGITFDKHNPGNYRGNCDTDNYGSGGRDCRWENCNPTTGFHNQMTVAIYVR